MFSFAGERSRNNSHTIQSSYEYYEEVEEVEIDIQSANKDPATAMNNQQDRSERNKKFVLYYATICEFYKILSTDANVLDNFKTTPKLLKFFHLTQLINSEEDEHKATGIDFALLLYRCDTNTHLIDITKDAVALETLQKHNHKEMWQKFRNDKF